MYAGQKASIEFFWKASTSHVLCIYIYIYDIILFLSNPYMRIHYLLLNNGMILLSIFLLYTKKKLYLQANHARSKTTRPHKTTQNQDNNNYLKKY